ncbi:MAG: MliC family protein [Pseudomonadota bacterium]
MKNWFHLLLLLLAAALFAGCAGTQKKIPQQLPGESLQATVFRCPDGFQFTVHWSGDGARADVVLPNATAFLKRDISGSGARYTASKMELWNTGDEAYLKLYEREYRGCREDRWPSVVMDARYRGVAFRGSGNEPPWVFEMGREMMVMITGYERETTVFPISSAPAGPSEKQPAPDIRKDAVSGEHRIRVAASPADCRDAMSGAAFPYRVRIESEKGIFRGCGGWLPPPPE